MSIEIASLFDLISDSFILFHLYYSSHTMWLTITIFTISCPYFTCYTSLMTFHIAEVRKMRKNKTDTFFKLISKVLFILPTMLSILVIVDILHMLLNLGIRTILLLIKIFTCGKINLLIGYDERFEAGIKKLLNMSYMDIEGFRTQKTILQLQLESIP